MPQVLSVVLGTVLVTVIVRAFARAVSRSLAVIVLTLPFPLSQGRTLAAEDRPRLTCGRSVSPRRHPISPGRSAPGSGAGNALGTLYLSLYHTDAYACGIPPPACSS
jgi:hypothetical protein